MKGGQQVGPSAAPPPHGSISRLKQENRDLKDEVERLRTALTRADSTIVWFEMRKAASVALLAVAEEILTERDRVSANIRLREAVAECRRKELK